MNPAYFVLLGRQGEPLAGAESDITTLNSIMRGYHLADASGIIVRMPRQVRIPTIPILISAFLVLLAATGLAGDGVQHVVFDSDARTHEKFPTEYVPTLMHEFPVSEHKWAIRDLNPDLPSDWSRYKFLVMEMKSSTPQRFLLRLYTADGMRAMRLHQFGGGVWIRAAVPLAYFQSQSQEGQDLAAVFNKPRAPFWMAVVGPFGPIKAVNRWRWPWWRRWAVPRWISATSTFPMTTRARRFWTSCRWWMNSDSGFPAGYAGKIKSLEQLKSEWDREDKSLDPGEFGYCKYGGYAGAKAKATGFFRVEQIDGKWWFVDPDGHLFLSTGVNGFGSYGGGTRIAGRENYYAAEPPADRSGSDHGAPPGAR